MDPVTVSLVAVTLVLLGLSVMLIEIPNPRCLYRARGIKGPKGHPILGNALDFVNMRREDLMGYFIDLTTRFPRLGKYTVGGVPFIIVQEPEDIQILLSSMQHIDKGIEYKPLSPWLKEGLLTSTGKKWQMRRKMLTPTFHFRILDDALSSINQKAKKFSRIIQETEGRSINISSFTSPYTLDVIGESAMGIDLKAQEEEGREYVSSVVSLSETIIQRLLSLVAHRDFLFYASTNGRTFIKLLKKIHEFTMKVIEDRRRLREKKDSLNENGFPSKPGKVRKAFLDCLLDIEKDTPGSLTNEDIREEVDTFMFEGHDTTSAALTFCLFILGSHMDIQERLHEEIDGIFGGDFDKDLTMKDVQQMTYLDKILKETLRLYPSVPFLSRRLNEDCVLEDKSVIPSGSNVGVVSYILHRNERFFPDPEKFDPERFNEENSRERHPFAYIPFSAGPRNCIGQRFAMLEMKIALAHLLKQLQVTSITKEKDFIALPVLVLRPSVPIKCSFTRRS